MEVYTVMVNILREKEILGVYSTLERAYQEVKACFGPIEKIEDEVVSDDCIEISTNTDGYWIYINTVDE